MKKIVLLMGLILFVSNLQAKTKTNNFGFGLMLGEPTGASFKYWLNGRNAFDGGIAFGTGLKIHADYLWHDFDVAVVEEGKLPMHYGAGLKIDSQTTKTYVGLRGVVGVTYIFDKEPFDIFFELAPVLNVSPSTSFELTGALGGRFYLK